MKIHYKDKWGIGCTITYAKEELPNADPRAFSPPMSSEELKYLYESIAQHYIVDRMFPSVTLGDILGFYERDFEYPPSDRAC
jgi:hypothetical protein